MPHPVLTKIVGESDYISLKKLRSEIKANASAIRSTLGGGAHRHLGLVLDPVAYAAVSATPWVTPVHPGDVVVIPVVTTSHNAAHLRDIHTRNLQHFNQADSLTKSSLLKLKMPSTKTILHLRLTTHPINSSMIFLLQLPISLLNMVVLNQNLLIRN